MKTNLQNSGDFTLSKEFLIELEELTNNYKPNEHPNVNKDLISKCLAFSRQIIIRQMLKSNQTTIAESYTKKVILSRAADNTYVNKMLLIVSEFVCKGQMSINFLIQMIK